MQRWRLHEKDFQIFKKAHNEDNWLWKKGNDTINKQTAGIVWQNKNLLDLQKNCTYFLQSQNVKDDLILCTYLCSMMYTEVKICMKKFVNF